MATTTTTKPDTTGLTFTLALDTRKARRDSVWNLTIAGPDGGIRRPISTPCGNPAPVVEASRILADTYGLDIRWSPIGSTGNVRGAVA